jgi:hypothetical protein
VALNDASLMNPSKVSGPMLEFELTVKLGSLVPPVTTAGQSKTLVEQPVASAA